MIRPAPAIVPTSKNIGYSPTYLLKNSLIIFKSLSKSSIATAHHYHAPPNPTDVTPNPS